MHGAAGAKARLKEGNLTKRDLRDRSEFLASIDPDTRELLRQRMISRGLGDSEAANKWLLEMLFGAPKSTIEVLVSRELVELCYETVADFCKKHGLPEDAYHEWAQGFNQRLPALLSSMSSTG
jgi:hypothetical protein